MGNEKKQSLYEVLGIERAADERTIKKAYFALVRKYPPETHAEEFKKIREAYEVLSNPVSRKDYDSVDQYDQYGEEVSARLKAGMEAMDSGDFRTAQREFTYVLSLQPQLHFARDLLGMAYLNNQQPAEALSQFDALVAAQPNNAVYHLHQGYAHHQQKHYGPAMAAYKRSKELDAIDTRALVAMADCLSAQQQYEAALAELDTAIQMDGQVDFQDFVFFLRRVQIQLLRNRADLAEGELDQIFKILPDDADTKKYVATRLASLAADLFAMKRSVDANRLLARCRLLDPSRASMSFQFPSRTKLPISVLPPASQTWLASHGKTHAAGKLKHNAWFGPVLLALIAAGAALSLLVGSFGATRLWIPAEQAQMFLTLVGATLLVGLAYRRLRRVAKSPYGKYTTIHPLHLMQVDVDQVTIWPLVNLHDVSLTHHSTNGVYQHTAIRMDFAGTICNLSIRGQQASVDWANRALQQRARVLELMSMGLHDAEEGYDLVPPAQLGPVKKSPADAARRTATWRFSGAGAAVGVLLGAAAIPYNRGAAERALWQSCSEYSSIANYRRYLEHFPKGDHAKLAKQGMNDRYEEAIALYQKKAVGADAKASQAIVDVIRALEKSGTQRVKITYDGSFDFSAIANLDKAKWGDVIAPDTAFSASMNKVREASITSALRRAFGNLLTNEVIDFDDGGYYYGASRSRATADSPVAFVVKYHVGPSGTIYESTTGTKKKLFGILFAWDFSIRLQGEKTDRYHLATVSSPAKDIRYTTYDDYAANSEIVPYTKMAESAFESFGANLAAGFGVGMSASPDDAVLGALGNLPRDPAHPRLSPAEMQKLIDNLSKGLEGKANTP